MAATAVSTGRGTIHGSNLRPSLAHSLNFVKVLQTGREDAMVVEVHVVPQERGASADDEEPAAKRPALEANKEQQPQFLWYREAGGWSSTMNLIYAALLKQIQDGTFGTPDALEFEQQDEEQHAHMEIAASYTPDIRVMPALAQRTVVGGLKYGRPLLVGPRRLRVFVAPTSSGKDQPPGPPTKQPSIQELFTKAPNPPASKAAGGKRQAESTSVKPLQEISKRAEAVQRPAASSRTDTDRGDAPSSPPIIKAQMPGAEIAATSAAAAAMAPARAVASPPASQIAQDYMSGTSKAQREAAEARRAKIAELDEPGLKALVTDNVAYLKDVFRGKVPSWRAQLWKNPAKRKELKYAFYHGEFTTVQVEAIVKMLEPVFFKKDRRYLEYTMDVLLPELLTRIYTSLFGLTTEEAEQALRADGTKVIPPQSA